MTDGVDLRARVLLGVASGLVLGKTFGVAGAAWLAVRLRWGILPAGVTWRQMWGAAALAGIGFTVSLFVAGLAFPEGRLQSDAKVGILLGSVVAATIGATILVRASAPGVPAASEAAPDGDG